MPVWKEKKGWRYRFQYQGQKYSKAWFLTKAAAKAAEADRRREVKNFKTPTATDLREVANEYLDFCKRRFSAKNYNGKVFIYRRFMENVARDRPFRDINGRLVESYLAQLPRSTNFNRHRKALCALFSWAFKRGLISVNPCIHVPAMPEEPKRKRIPSQEEMLKILLASGEYRPFFLCLYALAGRLGEVNSLRWEDVNFGKREVTLWTKKGRTGEMRPQIKPMNQEVFDVLYRLYSKKSGGLVFPNPKTGLAFCNRRSQIRQACLRAGVPYYPWHCIRHYVASFLSDKCKASLPTIQRMLGHLHVGTTSRYVQSLGKDVIEAADMLSIEQKFPQDLPIKKPDED